MTSLFERQDMKPDPKKLLEIAGMKIPFIGFYDVFDPKPFEPFVSAKQWVFSYYKDWLTGESICISENESSCRAAGYRVGGAEFASRDKFAEFLIDREGFKASTELMKEWLDSQAPYKIRHGFVVIGQKLKAGSYGYDGPCFYF